MAVRFARTTHQHVKIIAEVKNICVEVIFHVLNYKKISEESSRYVEQQSIIIPMSDFGYILAPNTFVRRFLVSQA